MSAPLRGDILLSRQASGLPRFSQAALASAAARCVCRSSLALLTPKLARSRYVRPGPCLRPGLSVAFGSFHRPPVGLLASGRDPRGSALSPHGQPLVGCLHMGTFVVGRDLGPSLPGPLSAPIILRDRNGNQSSAGSLLKSCESPGLEHQPRSIHHAAPACGVISIVACSSRVQRDRAPACSRCIVDEA